MTSAPKHPIPFRLGLVLKRAEQALMAEKSRVLRAFGLTVPQYAALSTLAETLPDSASSVSPGRRPAAAASTVGVVASC